MQPLFNPVLFFLIGSLICLIVILIGIQFTMCKLLIEGIKVKLIDIDTRLTDLKDLKAKEVDLLQRTYDVEYQIYIKEKEK